MTIRLQPITVPTSQGLAADMSHGDLLTPLLQEVLSAQYNLYRQNGAYEPWIGYLALEHSDGDVSVVGTCSFKDIPHDGKVEIAYFTFPGNEGRGIGQQMAAALVEIASRDKAVMEVTAHTLPEANASTRILEKLGFNRTGTVEDPEDGAIWRWARKIS